jgi:thiamine-phosphate pyrophosphorylase
LTICLVTDRRRLAGGAPSVESARRCLLEQVRHAVAARIDLIQLRERDLSAADLASLANDLLPITRGTPTRLVINDRLDVALACGADGVHLRADSVPVSEARGLAPPGFLVGRSVHSVAEAVAAGEADYLIAGTIFPTVSKQADAPPIGVEGLKIIAAAVSIPVLAIGGITVGSVRELARAGASGIAAIGLFLGVRAAEPDGCRAGPLLGVADAVRDQFDSRRAAS